MIARLLPSVKDRRLSRLKCNLHATFSVQSKPRAKQNKNKVLIALPGKLFRTGEGHLALGMSVFPPSHPRSCLFKSVSEKSKKISYQDMKNHQEYGVVLDELGI